MAAHVTHRTNRSETLWNWLPQVRWIVALVLALAVTLIWRLMPAGQLEGRAQLILSLYILSICLLFPFKYAGLLYLVAFLLNRILGWINQTKIALSQAPLTALDFQIAFANPRGLWISLKWPLWTLWAVAGTLTAALLFLVILSWKNVPRRMPRWPVWRKSFRIACASLTCGCSIWFAIASAKQLANRVYTTNDDLWEAESLATFSRSVGVVPFLLFSYYIASKDTGLYYDKLSGSGAPDRATLTSFASKYVTPTPTPQLPNIVVLFAESTFNPDWAFRLSHAVNHPLFQPQSDTAVVSGLHVNAVGGGSWIEEFESIVGIDSRLFGYSGYYTHATLSPFIRRTFVSYLNEKGYDSAGYYPWKGRFYNASRAYRNYGFRAFLDSSDLGLIDYESVDRTIAAKALERSKVLQKSPFFSYVVLGENHSPHPCRNFSAARDLMVLFADTQDFRMNCELNEYLRRVNSTWDAFEMWDRYLRELESATGRPYVLLTFGDHQPHTFTSTEPPHFDYKPERTSADLRETFFHLRSSLNHVVQCCDREPPPVTFLPSLLSAFTASSPDDLYLPENFYLYAHCGSDLLGRAHSEGVYDFARGLSNNFKAPGCKEAVEKGLASLHRENLF